MNQSIVTKQRIRRLPLLIPFIIYLFLSMLYLLAVPTGESPDEPGHLQCIEQVSVLGQLPQIAPLPEGEQWWSRGRIISGGMCYHMPLYYLVAGGLQKGVATAVSEPIAYEFPPTNQNFGAEVAMFEHPAKLSFWAWPEPMHLLTLRLFSILLGGVTVWASYRVGRRLFPGQPLVGLFAALLTAVWPQFLYLSRSLNNDGLATALAALVLVILLDVQRPQRFVWAMLWATLAIFTKLSVLFVVGVVFLVWGLEFWQMPTQRKHYLKILLVCLGLLGAAFLLIFFTPTLWHSFAQGSGAFASFSDSAKEWAYWQDVLRLTASSGWVRFGWMNVAAPQWHASVWWLSLLGTAVIGFWLLGQHGSKSPQRLMLIICGVWLFLIVLSYVQINMNRLQPQFRFALATIPILTSLSAAGWLRLLNRNGRLAIVGIATIVATLFFYNIWVVFSLLNTTYSWW